MLRLTIRISHDQPEHRHIPVEVSRWNMECMYFPIYIL